MSDVRSPEPERQPVFNLPDVVIFVIATLVAIQIVRENFLSPSFDKEILFLFAFIPARITELSGVLPGGEEAAVWSFVSYGLLHSNWSHVAINCLGLAA